MGKQSKGIGEGLKYITNLYGLNSTMKTKIKEQIKILADSLSALVYKYPPLQTMEADVQYKFEVNFSLNDEGAFYFFKPHLIKIEERNYDAE